MSRIITDDSREEIMNAALDTMNICNQFDKDTMQMATVQDIHFFTAGIREKLQKICRELNCSEALPDDLESALVRRHMDKVI